jgi:peptidoglycan/LPS O-acetylase OafA/YrhL
MTHAPLTPFRLGYRPWLDGLRGVAILVVVAQHLLILTGGFIGVDLFFVLSGFLITTLIVQELEQTGRLCLRRFYLRRALRLLPALVALIVFGTIYTIVALPANEAAAFRLESVVALGYVANWQKYLGVPMTSLGHTWSLAVEEQFYLLWPLFIGFLFARHASRKTILWCVIALIVASCVWRLSLHQYYRVTGTKTWNDMSRLYMGLDTRADALLTGCLLGLVVVWGKLPESRNAKRIVSVLAMLALLSLIAQLPTRHVGHPQYYDGAFTIVAISFGVILLHLLMNPAPVWRWCLECRWLVGIGRVSYGLYLIHVPLFHWMKPLGLKDVPISERIGMFLCALGLAVLSYYLIEKPFLRLKTTWRAANDSNTPIQAAEHGSAFSLRRWIVHRVLRKSRHAQ